MNAFRKFDSSFLTQEQRQLLIDLARRRQIFDDFLKENNIAAVTCPCCSYPTQQEKHSFEICMICNWQDDGQDDDNADEIWGGANGDDSLTKRRLEIATTILRLAKQPGGKINEDPAKILQVIEHLDYKNKYPAMSLNQLIKP